MPLAYVHFMSAHSTENLPRSNVGRWRARLLHALSSPYVRCWWTRFPKDRPVSTFESWFLRVGQALDIIAATAFVALIIYLVTR